MLDKEHEVGAKQLKQLKDFADPDVYALTLALMPEMGELDIKYRLPVMNIAIPALKQLSLDQYKSFRRNLIALIEADSRVDLWEWSLQKILLDHLDGQFFKLPQVKTRYSHLGQLKKETELILSVMAHAGHQNQNAVEKAFIAATEALELSGLRLLAKEDISLSDLDRALEKLAGLRPLAKPRLLKACAASIVHDQRISPVELELLRAFSDALDCPMPPVTYGARRGKSST